MNYLRVLKNGYIAVYKCFYRSIYNILSFLMKHDENKAVFILSRTNELEGNLKFIYDELIKQLPEVEIHLVFSENKMNLNLFKEILFISNARYLVLDDYYLPIYLINPKSKLKIIQLWHAAGAFKKFGYSTIGTRFGANVAYLKLIPIHSNYTHVYISAKKFVPFYAEAFNMTSEKIFPLGIPRIDLFDNEKVKQSIMDQIYADYPSLGRKDMVNILIAPTYRAKGMNEESSFEVIDTIIEISGLIKGNRQIVFHGHPYMDECEINRLKKCQNIIIANKYSINEWMLISDAFITDYSSSIFEYSLLERPLAHFAPDIDEYKENRGFYQAIDTISDGKVIRNNNGLVEWINARCHGEVFDTSNMVKFNFDNTEEVSKKIVNHFIS